MSGDKVRADKNPADKAGDSDKAGNSGKTGKLKKRKLIAISASILLVLALGAGFAGWYGWNFIILKAMDAPGPAEQQTTFVIKPGSGVGGIAAKLEAADLISDARLFRVKSKIMGDAATLKAGEYAIGPRASINDIFAQLQAGKIVQHSITIAEGRTSREILDIIRQSEVLSGEITEVPPEGVLLPETYLVTRGTDRAALVQRMQDDMNALLDKEWEGRDADLPIRNKTELLVLASIVEKETGMDGERARVAAVFVNRMRRGMRLESDPTIIYGLTGGRPLGRGLRRSEIARQTAWNTYQIDGLPPTPICNPGRDAIMAVLHPAQTKDLYFVADGNGGHAFATSYRQHLRNVAKWRQIERQRKRATQ